MNKSYFETCNEYFGYFVSSIQLELKKNNKMYIELEKENKKLFKKYPNVNKLFESINPNELNSKECLALVNILENLLSQKYMELEAMFFKGQKEILYTINRMDSFDANKDTNKES